MSFIIDFKVGKTAEKKFAKYLIDFPWFVSLEMPRGKCKDWDIILTTKDKIITYEVKSDTMADKTWNFVVEYRFRWEASGIYASKADFIVYNILWEWRIQKRAELILRLQETEKREVKWWDGWNSDLYIIKVEELPNLFEKLNIDENI